MMKRRGRKPGLRSKKVDISKENVIEMEQENKESLEAPIRQPEESSVDAESSESKSRDNDLPSAEDIFDDPRFNRNPLERNLGSNFQDIEFTHPDLTGYWAADEHIAKYIGYGYAYAEPSDVKDYQRRFAEINPGQGMSPDGRIKFNGLTLLVAPKDIAKRKHDDAYRKRVKASQIQGNLNQSEMRQRGMAV